MYHCESKTDERNMSQPFCAPIRQIYLHREGMARFCTKKYEAPTSENLGQTFMHLTNYTLNKNSEDFKHSATGNDNAHCTVDDAHHTMPDYTQGDVAEDSDAGSKRYVFGSPCGGNPS
jgi:hypothetical protein